jgi:hypothetical protein
MFQRSRQFRTKCRNAVRSSAIAPAPRIGGHGYPHPQRKQGAGGVVPCSVGRTGEGQGRRGAEIAYLIGLWLGVIAIAHQARATVNVETSENIASDTFVFVHSLLLRCL